MTKPHNPKTITDERFIAQLGIISVQNRIDLTLQNQRWVSRYAIAGRKYHIQGFAADFGRPRGVDADVLTSLETLFLLQGCPADNTVTTTAHEVLQLSNIHNKGENYYRLKESLMRLWRVGFLITEAHAIPGSTWRTYFNKTLSLITEIQFWGQSGPDESSDLQALVADGKLTVQLSAPLAHSIRGGYTHLLDRQLLSQIEQPIGRGTYRVLQAHRPEEGSLSVTLADWGQACGIISREPDKIRRSLQSAHEELEANAYLEGVEFMGRGQQQEIIYHFRASDAPDRALVTLLTEQYIPRKQAEQLARAYPERVEEAVRYVQLRRQEGKVKSPGALTSDILRNPDKYNLSLPELAPVRPAVDLKVVSAAEEAKADAKFRDQQQVLLSQEPPQQWEASRPTLKLLIGKHVSDRAFQELQRRCETGEISATELTRELTALSTNRAALRQRLAELQLEGSGNLT